MYKEILENLIQHVLSYLKLLSYYKLEPDSSLQDAT